MFPCTVDSAETPWPTSRERDHIHDQWRDTLRRLAQYRGAEKNAVFGLEIRCRGCVSPSGALLEGSGAGVGVREAVWRPPLRFSQHEVCNLR
jgi:hypothetical protein